MNNAEAKSILSNEPRVFASRPYDELVKLISETAVRSVLGDSGVNYQIEMDVLWDSSRKKICASLAPSTTAVGAPFSRSQNH